MRRIPVVLVVLVASLFIASQSTAWAHNPGLSTLVVTVGDEQIVAGVTLSNADTQVLLGSALDSGKKLTAVEFDALRPRLEAAGRGAIELFVGDYALPLNACRVSMDDKDNVFIHLAYPRANSGMLRIVSKLFPDLPLGHRQFLKINDSTGRLINERMLSARANSSEIEIAAVASGAPPETTGGTIRDFLVLGIRHIWTGYDHLLFLFGLLIVSTTFRTTVKIITCFTIAHSITLSIAACSSFEFPSTLVEPLIAASIVYVGLENILRTDCLKWRDVLTFVFGLIHGLGFASALRELGVGSNGSSLIVPLVSFNLGVEFGQIAIAAVALPVIWQLRKSTVFVKQWVPACSIVVVLTGTYWLADRIFL